MQLNTLMRIFTVLFTNREVGIVREDESFANIGNSPIIFDLIVHNKTMVHEVIECDRHPLFLPKNPNEMIYTVNRLDMDLSHLGTETRWKLRDGAKILTTEEDTKSPILRDRIKYIRRSVKDYLETIELIKRQEALDLFLRTNFPQKSFLDFS